MKLKYEELISNFGFTFYSCRYTMEGIGSVEIGWLNLVIQHTSASLTVSSAAGAGAAAAAAGTAGGAAGAGAGAGQGLYME